ncbi:hypothetical protein [Oceanobacillus sp. CAU 1775]
MEVLVINYTDWIGYHIVDDLLERGYKVYGVEDQKGNPNLKDFFTRNSNFKHFDLEKTITCDYVICIGNINSMPNVTANHYFLINGKNHAELENIILIRNTYLFGEFMPMDEIGWYVDDKRIDFASDLLKKEGVYIGSFTAKLIDLLEQSSRIVNLVSKNEENQQNEVLLLDKSFFVDENVPIGKEIDKVRKHYEKFKALYLDYSK